MLIWLLVIHFLSLSSIFFPLEPIQLKFFRIAIFVSQVLFLVQAQESFCHENGFLSFELN